MISARQTFQRDASATLALRSTVTQPWFEQAILAARSECVSEAKSLDEIKGADRFANHLLSLAEPLPEEPAPIDSGIQHDIDYGRNSPRRTALEDKRRAGSKSDGNPVTGKAALAAAAKAGKQS